MGAERSMSQLLSLSLVSPWALWEDSPVMPELQRQERGRSEGAWPLSAWVELAKQVGKRRDCPPRDGVGFPGCLHLL